MPLIRDTKVLNLSTQSSSGTLLNGDKKSKVAYELRNFIDYENDQTVEYISVSMPYVVLCNSCYIINDTNNTIVCQQYSGDELLTTTTVAFAVGNYNVNTFISQWNYHIGNLGGVTISFNANKQKFSLTLPSGGFSRVVFTAATTMDYIIGFTGSLELSVIDTPVEMPRCANFLPLPRFNIVCDWLNNGAMIASSGSSFSSSTIMASVPNNSKNNNMIVYESAENEFLLKTINVNNITISIMDDRGNYVDFNGVASYFSLRFNIFRRRLPKLLPFNRIVDFASTLIPTDAQELDYA